MMKRKKNNIMQAALPLLLIAALLCGCAAAPPAGPAVGGDSDNSDPAANETSDSRGADQDIGVDGDANTILQGGDEDPPPEPGPLAFDTTFPMKESTSPKEYTVERGGYRAAVTAPFFGVPELDVQMDDFIADLLDGAGAGYPHPPAGKVNEICVEYVSNSLNQRYVSVKFDVISRAAAGAQVKSAQAAVVADLSDGRLILPDELMTGEVIALVREETTSFLGKNAAYSAHADMWGKYLEADESFYFFLFTPDMVTFFYDKGALAPGGEGSLVFTLPLSEIRKAGNRYWPSPSPARPYPLREEDIVGTFAENVPDPEPVNVIINGTRVIDPDRPMVALTFDDGPASGTGRILDALKKYNGAATFFVQGSLVRYYPSTLERMISEGSQIGNHTWNHEWLTKLDGAGVDSQVSRTQQAVFDITGVYPLFLRPSYGSINQTVKEHAGLPMIMWSVDPQDWLYRDPENLCRHILTRVKDGDIIIMHDIHDSTVKGVDILIPYLVDMGFQLVTVSELFEARGIEPEAGQPYYRAYK